MNADPSRRDAWRPTASLETLQRSAERLRQMRAYFQHEGVLEVSTPVLSAVASSEPTISNYKVENSPLPSYLRSSPESYLKRLVAAGYGDVYELGAVFRAGELGRYHQPEFTMLEWYRVGFDHHRLMDDLCGMLRAIGFGRPPKRLAYGEVLQTVVGLELARTDNHQLAQLIDPVMLNPRDADDRALLLDAIYVQHLEPYLATLGSVLLYDFPPEHRAYARLSLSSPVSAARFELIVDGIEIANGYHEITDATEQRECFRHEQALRAARGLSSTQIDELWLAALEHGLQDVAGVAVGWERLLLVMQHEERLEHCRAFASKSHQTTT